MNLLEQILEMKAQMKKNSNPPIFVASPALPVLPDRITPCNNKEIRESSCATALVAAATTTAGNTLPASRYLQQEKITLVYVNDNVLAKQTIGSLCSKRGLLPMALDFETEKQPSLREHPQAGLCPHLSKIRLASCYAGGDTVYVLDMRMIDAYALEPLMRIPLVAHNAVFEIKHLLHAGLSPLPVECTLLMANALDGNRPKLSTLSQQFLGWSISKEHQTSDWGATSLSQDQLAYAALDAVITHRLYPLLHEQLKGMDLLPTYELMRGAQLAVAQLELNGFLFDHSHHTNLIATWSANKQAAEKTLRTITGPSLSLTSPQKLSRWIEAHFPPAIVDNWPRTPKGNQLQINNDVLRSGIEHPLIDPLKKFRDMEKLLSTFGEKFQSHIHPVTGRIHSQFMIAGAATGRFTCSKPNLQQMPKDKAFRSLFVAPANRTLVVADYSQIELRVAALVSEDAVMLEAYENGEDLHRITAAALAGIPVGEVTSTDRQKAKAVNFGLLYGQGAPGLVQYAQANYGLNLTLQEARDYRSTFFRTYKDLALWQKIITTQSKRSQDVVTPWGRRRDFSTETRGYRYTEALNTPIQGGAAEVMLAALACLEKHLQGMDAKLVNIIHDEIVLEGALVEAERIKVALESAMVEGMLTIFPKATTRNLVEVHSGPNWAQK